MKTYFPEYYPRFYVWNQTHQGWGSLSETVIGHCRYLKTISLLYQYFLDRHMCRQEQLLAVGLHQNTQYTSTTEDHQVMAKLIWSGGNFQVFAIITFSSGILSVISSVLSSVCC